MSAILSLTIIFFCFFGFIGCLFYLAVNFEWPFMLKSTHEKEIDAWEKGFKDMLNENMRLVKAMKEYEPKQKRDSKGRFKK